MSFITDLFDGGARKSAQKYQKAQTGIAQQQSQEAQDVLPQYMKGLDFLSQYAGLGNFHPQGYGAYGAGAGGATAQNAHNPQDALAGLGSQYQPPAQQQGWNWNQPGATAAPAAQSPQAMAYAGSPGLNLNMQGKGDGNAMGPNPYGKGDAIPGLPAVNPPQMGAPGAMPPPAQVQGAAPPVQSRQQQFIQSNPGLGAFNPNQSGSQNRQQINAAPAPVRQAAQAGAGGMGPSPYAPGGTPATGGVSNSQMGIFNDPADALRNAQAQDDINHQNFLGQQQFRSQMGDRGLEDSSIMGGGLARMQQDANQQYAGYRRNLAMNAGQEQMNRVMQMMGALNPGMGAQQQAAGNYGNLGQQSFQQQQNAQQGLAGMGNLFGQLYGYGMF